MNRYNQYLRILEAILGLGLFLIPGLAAAQSVPDDSRQPPLEVVARQRSQQAYETLDAATRKASTTESRIGPDDLLNISIFEAPEMNCTVRVTPSGQFSMPLLGAIQAGGLTPHELESVLQGRLRGTYMKDPHVGVFVQELQSHAVSVVGAVKMPGVFQIRGTTTVIEILSMAQGLADDAGKDVLVMRGAESAKASNSGVDESAEGVAADRRFPEIFPKAYDSAPSVPEKKSEIVEIDLKKLLESADSALNVPVRPGDIVKVPRAGIVYVVGEVTKPGGFVLQNNENISVLQALALAEGPTHTSAISHARIIRTDPATGKRTEIPANLGKIFSGKAPDTFLQPKDVVFVPNSATKSVLYRTSEAALQTAAGVAIYKW